MSFDIRKKDQAKLAKLAQWEKEKKERRELRRKAAKKRVKDKENIRKQRHLARLNPTSKFIPLSKIELSSNAD